MKPSVAEETGCGQRERRVCRRDFDNYTPKFILDVLKGCLIPDDSSAVIEDLRLRFEHDRAHPRTGGTLHLTRLPQLTPRPL